MSEKMIKLILSGLGETIIMTFFSGFGGFLIGLPVGVLLFMTRPNQILANAKLFSCISLLVNIFRAIPFIILLYWMIPVTRTIVGTSYGIWAAIVPLTVSAAPFIARMAEKTFLEVPSGLIEAARSMGATPLQIIIKVLIPEALPGLINSITIVLISLVGYSAMGGAISAGGLGQIAHQYGYVGYNLLIMNTVLVIIICLVIIIQKFGDYLSKKVSHR